ncbi:MAG TPA: nitronate monooxygenase, partial [Acidimicrobiales bacterium]|nr:nitronate monooxygenase [Acidimicrobiales bacterium]
MDERDLIVGVSPGERPDPAVVVGLVRAGALDVLDLGRDATIAGAALAEVTRGTDVAFGVRVPEGAEHDPAALPDAVDTVVLAAVPADPADATAEVGRWAAGGRRVLVEVRTPTEADAAVAAGVAGLIAKGAESGGRIGDLTAYVLLQDLVARTDLPVWSQGGIGRHTAAAAVAGGATGVVVDAQLALVRESTLPAAVRHAVGAMDGSETVVVGHHRLFTRPDLPVNALDPDTDPAEVVAHLGAGDLRAQYLPVGQDGAFAAPLARRFGTAGGLAQGLRAAIDEHLAAATARPPLGEGNPLAATLGTRYPIAQGPMTRVSDRAAFAAAVAEGGGLPFLALALMTGDEVRALLEETAPLLGDRPWGVGILGFVPPEVREAQLEVVHEVRPPVALIAGGRPSQAAPLEAAGISTFLHVPSPGLLDLFLKEGARKFVFEGRECGGHVGPRSSFALWDAQIEHLLAFGHLDEVSVLFAGGVHDARSAAMVGALAAPLAEAGAGVGVLMGTSYLFTEEAVAGGAILPGFQQAAVDCERTVLLETSPGHATRCVESEYVRAFEAAKRRLLAEGHTVQEAWAELEQLNLGRLRIATKGVAREGGELVEVDEDGQRREGMFMIGQAATLRHEVTTVAALHDEVSAGSTAYLADLGATRGDGDGAAEARPIDIAIVGMAAAFPGAPDTARYWSNVVAGVDAITEVPADR